MAHIPERPRPMQSMLAAAKRLESRKITRRNLKEEDWQTDAWKLLGEVGELRFVANAISGNLSRARIHAATLDEQGEAVPIDPEDEDLDAADQIALEAINALGEGLPGRSEMLRRLALHLFVPGESWVVGTPPEESVGEVGLADMEWQVLSNEEIDASRSTKVTIKAKEENTYERDDIILVRVWRPHPQKWWKADSPVRSARKVLHQLVNLTDEVDGTIDSRLSGAGILAVAGEAAPDIVNEKGESVTIDEAVTEAAVTAREDLDSAAAIAPLVIKFATDDVRKAIQHHAFSGGFDSESRELTELAIRRLALSVDVPPEILLGLSDVNHWNAWAISEDTVTTHIEPVLALICDALTKDYLRPFLEEARVDADVDNYVVWYDVTPLTVRPDKSKNAFELHDRGVIDDAALRRETSFNEEDAPEHDRAVDIVLTMAQREPGPFLTNPSLFETLVEAVRALLDQGEPVAETEPSPVGNGQRTMPEPVP